MHLHVKWPGRDAAETNEGRFPGQCYVTSIITPHRPSVYKRRALNLQLKMYPVFTNEYLMKQVSQFI